MLGDAARVWRFIFSKACLKWLQWMELSKNVIPLKIISSTKQPPNSFSWWDDPTLCVHKTFFSQATPADDSFYCFPQVGFLLHSISSCWKSSEPGQPHVSAPLVTEGWSRSSRNPTASAHQECDTNRSFHLQINAGHCTRVSAKLTETFQGSSLLSGVTTELGQNHPSAQQPRE